MPRPPPLPARIASFLRERGRPGRWQIPGGRRSFRPLLELLEARTLLSIDMVTNNSDGGNGSLRAVIGAANAGDTIEFQSGLTGTIKLTGGVLSIAKNLDIEGPGAGVLEISGNGASSVFQVGSGVTATIAGLTIIDGTSGVGGGINNAGTLAVNDCTLSGNTATADGNGIGGGGGIENTGTLSVTNSTLSYNSATAGFGGGIDNNGTATVTYSTLSGNSAGSGGGIYNSDSLTVSNSTLAGNLAGAGGGGIRNDGTAAVISSTLLANAVGDGPGGGIDNFNSVTVTSSTLSANSASSAGGGVFTANRSAVIFANTIVATNNAMLGPDVDGTVTSAGCNLIGSDAGASGFTAKTDILGVDPQLGSLQYNGGPTETMVLLPDSPAIHAATTASYPGTTTPITTDQRGFALDSSAPDIGAFQTQPGLVVNTTVDGAGTSAGDLSLRQAVNLAEELDPTETITFDATFFNKPQTITLLAGPLVLSNTGGPLTITGPASRLTVSGGGNTEVFVVDPGVTATLAGLTIAHGSAAFDGGGIYNAGTLTLTGSTLSGNSAFEGGGIFNKGTLTVTSSTLTGNTANVEDGGAIDNSGTLTLTSSTLVSNSSAGIGGGIDNTGEATVTNCTFSDNVSSGGGGGGVYNEAGGTMTVTSSALFGNSATESFGDGGGIENDFSMTIINSTISGNSVTGGLGGGIANFGAPLGRQLHDFKKLDLVPRRWNLHRWH